MKRYSPLKPILHSQQSTNYEYDDNSAASSDESEYSVTNSEMLHVVLRRLRKIVQDNEIVKISLKTKDMQIKQLEMEVERLRRRRRDDDGNSDTESIASDAQPLITINNHNNSTTSNIESPASNAEISAVFPFDMVQITNAIAGLNVEAGDGQKAKTAAQGLQEWDLFYEGPISFIYRGFNKSFLFKRYRRWLFSMGTKQALSGWRSI